MKTDANSLLHPVQEVDVLREKIKDSEVKVEIDSQNSNLAEMLNQIRNQYDKLAKKNLKETEEWYQSKVDLTRLNWIPLGSFFLSHTRPLPSPV